MSRRNCLVAAVLMAGAALPMRADTLVLYDGRRIAGEVSQNDAGNYVVKTKAGQVTFSASDVSKWEKGGPATPAGPMPLKPAGPIAAGGGPDQKADPAAVTARAAKLVERGNGALLAGDAQAALENFQDAKLLWDRQRIRMDYNNPAQFECLHGLGISYLALGRYEKANDPLDRAYASSLKGRSLTVNRAILDLVQKTNVARGVKEMKDFLAKQAIPDEVAMNVFGAGIGVAGMDEHFAQQPYFQGVAAFYESQNKLLEANHSGEERWGAEWMSSSAASGKKKALEDGLKKYKAAVETERKAEGLVRQAQSDVDGLALSRQNPAQAYDNLANAKQQLATATVLKHEAWKKVPRPEWPKTFMPVLPESVGGGVFGSPAPQQVAVATPAPPSVADLLNPEPKKTPVVPLNPVPPVAPPVQKAAKRTVYRSAVAVPVGPDLVVTAAAPIDNATEYVLETAGGNSFKAEFVRKDAATGVALLRIPGQRMAYLNLAASFNGGEVTCWGYPDVSIFSPVAAPIGGTTTAPRGNSWSVAMLRQPRIPGAAIVDKSGRLVGIALGDRDTVASQIPAVTVDQLRTFLGADAPKAICSNSDPGGVMQLTASREAQ